MSTNDPLTIYVDSSESELAEAESNQPVILQPPMENGEDDDELTGFVRNELEIITSPTVDVYRYKLRVPEQIKKLNPEAYKPRLISIGPVFHGQSELRPMEAFKKRYAHNFIEKYHVEIKELINITKEFEKVLREAYGMESSEISSKEFVKIMVIDGAFLLEFLSRHYNGTYEEIDRMTRKKWNIFASDLFLLENQIPRNYLDNILYLSKYPNKATLLVGLVDMFINETVLPQFVMGSGRPPFFRDVLDGHDVQSFFQQRNFLSSLRMRMLYTTAEKGPSETWSSASCPTISQLHRVGIKIRPIPSRLWLWDAKMPMCRHGIAFRRGVLEIPRFIIDENTERYYANLLALELFREKHRYVTDYVALMDYFIDDPEDVRILVENDILQNLLRDDRAAADLINKIGKSIDVRPDFCYSDIVQDLNSHSKKRWNRLKFEWKRELATNYFRNPWRTTSVVAAALLLGFTIAQTVCSFLQLNKVDSSL